MRVVVHDAETDDRAPLGARGGDRVREEQDADRQRAFGIDANDVAGDPDAADEHGEQRVTAADDDRRVRDENGDDRKRVGIDVPLGVVRPEHREEAEHCGTDRNRAIDDERVQRTHSIELSQEPGHQSNVPNSCFRRIGPAMDTRVIPQMYAAGLAANHLQADEIEARNRIVGSSQTLSQQEIQPP